MLALGALIQCPHCELAMATLFVCLNVQSDKTLDYIRRRKRIDLLGNILLVLAMVSFLIALSWSGSSYPWSSYRFIISLVMSFVGG